MTTDRTLTTPLRICAALIAVGFLVLISWGMQHTISCFLLAFVIAYLLDPLVLLGERKGLRRSQAIGLLYLLLLVLTVITVTVFLPYISISFSTLMRNTPGYLLKGKELLLQLKDSLGPRFDTPEAAWLIDNSTKGLDKIAEKAGAFGYAALTRTLFNIFNLVLSPILVFFMLLYKQQIIAGITKWLPENRRAAILQAGRETNASVSGYIRGQLIVSLIVAVLSTVTLYFLDIDYALLNGIFAGLASVLPFIGVIIAMLPALFFAYVKFQSGLVLLKVIASFAVIYFLEGYLVKPLVFKEAMDLNPLTTIIMVMACGELFGFWGILLAIPLAAAIKIFASYARRGAFSSQEIV
jgi:putative permease